LFNSFFIAYGESDLNEVVEYAMIKSV